LLPTVQESRQIFGKLSNFLEYSAPMKRYLESQIRRDLKRKMVFVGGPRQVGKTTLARAILGGSNAGYLSWDIEEHCARILRGDFPRARVWAFDELHKYRRWRGLLKGLFDARDPRQQVLVTGSARLDYYRFGGDSLQGRYHYLRLHPLSAAELGIESPRDLTQDSN
jgi:predicted AAA+ superfamily ATPase